MIDIVIPKWGLTMEEAVLVEWYRAEGEPISEGEAIAEVETDKANSDIESPASGIVRELLVEAGASVVPGQVVARIEPQ
ncbi:lipoyl domain-containing protein [Intrasporangium calvum]|uniref:Biotin/lipoyl attachment domain-containing protein n=1 Tax=Intrasporangium calvum (strain ATCC 23552 / DSM 43043 / JCM 3097 / NBRC 12989 / NCIMB 10167 / NRRL B-3866 / 7 KIP) TaxID=710696 RepID=E6SCL8_INTC7|nr:lipoyl domain-containing protein [Intrasporangium calvum]ADU49622.1 biotin/lipoyl attachment domain-containing protein [Intrasporangium calvum DSM 43043]